jgi:hypothetical protein
MGSQRANRSTYNKFIPPPVPDDQNLAAIPLFKLEHDPTTDPFLYPVALKRAMRTEQYPGNDLPWKGNWMRGELPDMTKIHHTITNDYSVVFKGVAPPADTLAQFDALYPFLTDLRAAATTRPLCRFDSDYTISPPAARPLELVTAQVKLSHILTLHAILALNQNQSDPALEDIEINYKLLSGVKRDPTLVGGLVAIAMNAVDGAAIYDGLALHAWNDAQLAELEQTLEPINFLADYQFAMRSEAAESVASIDYYKKVARRPELYGLFGMGNANPPRMIRLPVPWPGGWWDDNMSQMASFLLHEMATVDPQSQRVFPEVDFGFQHRVDLARARWDATAPWNIWFTLAAPALDAVMQKYAYAQNWVDEARIACALERYRLTHNTYPDSLDALVPVCIDELPHDIINGQPYHYRLRPDGTFLLYSVGWNQTDDGGKVVYKKDAPTQIDNQQGDWVWPTVK